MLSHWQWTSIVFLGLSICFIILATYIGTKYRKFLLRKDKARKPIKHIDIRR